MNIRARIKKLERIYKPFRLPPRPSIDFKKVYTPAEVIELRRLINKTVNNAGEVNTALLSSEEKITLRGFIEKHETAAKGLV